MIFDINRRYFKIICFIRDSSFFRGGGCCFVYVCGVCVYFLMLLFFVFFTAALTDSHRSHRTHPPKKIQKKL